MKQALFAAILLAAVLASGAPPPAAAQVEVGCTCWCGVQLNPPCSEYACRSACGEGGSAPAEPVNIAWGGMTKRFLNMVEECGPKPACRVFRTVFGVPIGLMYDGPVWLVKGVGYGLYYGGKGLVKGVAAVGGGVGKGFKAVGRAFAAPGRKRAAKTQALAAAPAGNCSAASVSRAFHAPQDWEACKQAVFKRQKAITKLNPGNKANELWCRKNIPLSSGAQRFHWETRCNPGVSAVLVEPPLSDPLGSPSPTTSATVSSAKPPAGPAAKPSGSAGPSGAEPVAEPDAGAQPAGSLDAELAAAGLPPGSLQGRDPAETARLVEAGLLPASALRDPASLVGQPSEESAAAGRAGFDAQGAMLGRAGAAPPLAGQGAAEARRDDPTSQSAPAAAVVRSVSGGGQARGAQAAPSGQAPPGAAPAAGAVWNPKVAPRPEVVSGKAELVGDPERFRYHFTLQTGNTCALVSIKQVLGDLGRPWGENDLFWDAFAKGFITAGFTCDDLKDDGCRAVPDPESGLCGVVDRAGRRLPVAIDAGGKEVMAARHVCRDARGNGGMLPAAIGDYLALTSGRRVRNDMVPSADELRAATGTDDLLSHAWFIRTELLAKARAEVVATLRKGNPVIVAMDAPTLRRKPGPRAMHAVLVTAAVVGADGTPLGYYVNDSATYEHGRFLAAADFDQAWLGDDLQRVYIE